MQQGEKLVIAFDFDGTLAGHGYPQIGPIQLDTFGSAIALKKLGCEIVLWTCRHGELLANAVQWCADRGLEFDAVNTESPGTRKWKKYISRKIYADIYVDDRGLPPAQLNAIIEYVNKRNSQKK